MDAVNRFYDSYYFRPRVAWRIVRDALWDSHERKRLYHEAVDFLKLRADRMKVSRTRRAWIRRPWSPCRAMTRVPVESPASRRAHDVVAGLHFKTSHPDS